MTEEHSQTQQAHETQTFAPPTIASEPIAHINGFELRNTLLTSWIVLTVLIIGALIFFRKSHRLIPSGFQNFVESIIEGLYNFMHSITLDHRETKRFFALVATIFIYVFAANVMGLFPGVGTIGFQALHEGHEVFIPIFRSVYSDVNMTAAIAIISVFATQMYGIISLGFFRHFGKFFVNPLKDPIGTFVGILELISEFAKMVSFSFRLYGNIFAGEVLLAVMGFLLPFIAPLPFYGLELFVAFIQALVFALLTLVFLKMATVSHAAEH